MKEFLQEDPGISSDTYLGARMNQKALDFHTQLHDWSEAQKLSTLASKHANILSTVKDGEVFLPVKKLAHIEYWTRQVNRYYRPNRACRPKSGSFMKIDVTKYNMKVDKNEPSRSKSALYPQRQRPVTAVTRLPSAPRRQFFGTDVHTVNNNLIDSQMHYSAQRKDLYSATTRKSMKSGKANELKPELFENGVSEMNGSLRADTESETITVIENTDSLKVSDPEYHGHSHIDTEVMQPQIVSRSWSNRMLNVISIDDCKLTCRYRPQIIKENHPIPDDLDAMQKARANKLRYDRKKVTDNKDKVKPEKETKVVNGHEADDEAENSEDTVDLVENLESLCIDEGALHTNNNNTADACHIDTAQQNATEPETNNLNNELNIGFSEKNIKDKSTSSESTEKSDRSNLRLQFDVDKNGKGQVQEERNPSSQGASKTSYGRITTLYSNSETSKSKAKDGKKKKKVSRTSRINYAINDMVHERKVMNSLERDFDTRTAEFGRTIVEKTEGSETFKKIHANLRKKIDAFVDTHSAVKTKEFYERSRSNSARNSVTSP
ncbi:uncharacterized protein LOC123564219 isoform X2 [Mercenaria mercenaria]|nr:uncharacterized protein LOC123564219 isoform X2 [Mercenaria mercenaria]XP_045213544.2 uncharacterized protein LOC123564219 isoform X2 [Mercenaria mercenaria]XP_045213546.2 uncharacterized protein LOC123564219 isoform X2 [Mercenaria mercenaria]XP_053392826.1 uncharacterized protein LOC123564219 isoform X2 [Mercenaria mercenaria]